MEHFREEYKTNEITKWDIFYYAYGILHSEEYRETYKNDLFREIARIPLLKTYEDFKKVSAIGKNLSDWHVHYEGIEANPKYYRIEEKEDLFKKKEALGDDYYKVKKMKFDRKAEGLKLQYNEHLCINNISREIEDYKISGRNVLAWMIANYQVKTLDNGYIKDPNNYKGGKYIFDLVLKLITLAVESTKLIKELPKIEGNYKEYL